MHHNPPQIFVFFGMIATGKSTLAKMWAKAHEMYYCNSDVIRKELARSTVDGSEKSSFGQGIYSADFSQKTYSLLLARAEAALKNNQSIVLDASYSLTENRQHVSTLADTYKVPIHFIYCTCPEDEMHRRMDERAKDAQAVSDGRWDIYLQQKETFEAPDHLADTLIRFDTSSPPEQLLEELEQRLYNR